jgi:hypothetical protein
MLRGFSQLVVVYFLPFTDINQGSNHANRHRFEILRRTVQKVLFFRALHDRNKPNSIRTFPCRIKTSWCIYIYIYKLYIYIYI